MTATPRDLLNMARGLAAFFWSLPALVMILTNTPDILASGRVRIPFLALGVLAVASGLLLLSRKPDATPTWRGTLRWLYGWLLTLTALAPFVYWWRQFPRIPLFAVNALLFAVALTALLYSMNKLAGEVGRVLRDPTLYIEAVLCRWAVLIAVLVPTIVVGALTYRAIRLNSAFTWVDWLPMQAVAFRWLFGFFILPFSLTLAITWRAKNLCFESLKLCAKLPPLSDEKPLLADTEPPC